MADSFRQKLLRNLSVTPLFMKIGCKFISIFSPTPPMLIYRNPDYQPAEKPPVASGKPIFITTRFRSGSTFLWQVFDRLDGFTAYYEPLNERGWFNVKPEDDKVDETHRGVSIYSSNYDKLSNLSNVFSAYWTSDYMMMNSEKDGDGLNMKSYIKALVGAANHRSVLQFNRVDFRLPWLAKSFPEASIIHLERNVRDVWVSTLKGQENDPHWTVRDFYGRPGFYLVPWYLDLCVTYPWMICDIDQCHPYQIHYLIWRLSQIYAWEYADYFISYDELCDDLPKAMAAMIGGSLDDYKGLDGLVSKRVKAYSHDDTFYSEIEEKVELLLQEHIS